MFSVIDGLRIVTKRFLNIKKGRKEKAKRIQYLLYMHLVRSTLIALREQSFNIFTLASIGLNLRFDGLLKLKHIIKGGDIF